MTFQADSAWNFWNIFWQNYDATVELGMTIGYFSRNFIGTQIRVSNTHY